jgi:hypothetical protein
MKTMIIFFLAIMVTSILTFEPEATLVERVEDLEVLQFENTENFGELIFLQALECHPKCTQAIQVCQNRCLTYSSTTARTLCKTSCNTDYKYCTSKC